MPGSQPNPAPYQYLRKNKKRIAKVRPRRPDQVREHAGRLAVPSVKEQALRRVHAARDPLVKRLNIPFLPHWWTDDHRFRIITHLGADWRKIQTYFQSDPDGMRALVRYREKYINGLINELAADETYRGLIACASGSKDLASDYDVTLGTTTGGKADALAAAELTRRIKEKFGKQSATVFDTNFYLCDFLGEFQNNIVRNQAGRVINAKAARQATPASVEYQDVLALLKTRRYMTEEEWEDYTVAVERDSERPQPQFDRAEAIHERNLGALVWNIVGADPDAEIENVLKGLDSDEDRLHALDQLCPDRVREVADLLCSECNKQLRYLDAKLAAIDPLDFPAEVAKLSAQIEQVTGDAAFFASEAYHTEGALLQIVLKRDNLTAAQCLDSINEQFGDFVKDVRHYTGERDRDGDPDEEDEDRERRVEFANGVMYFRGAKYMSRLFQAIVRLKATKPDMQLLLLRGDDPVDPERLRDDIERRLMPLRRNPEGRPVEERAVAAQVAIRDLFPGVESPEHLKDLLTQWVAQVNAAARK